SAQLAQSFGTMLAGGSERVVKRTDLSLMNEQELDFAILIATLAAPAETLCSNLIHALTVAFTDAGYGARAIAMVDSISPRSVIHCYVKAMEGTLLEPEIRVPILSAFERFVLRNLHQLYRDLIEATSPVRNRVLEIAGDAPAAPPPVSAEVGPGVQTVNSLL